MYKNIKQQINFEIKERNNKYGDPFEHVKQLQSELDAYKIALKFFADQSQANREIAKQILTSMEVTHGS